MLNILKQLLAVVTATFIVFSSSWAGTCRTDTLVESTPTSRFSSLGETVTDQETTLSWMRCAVGQQWDGKSCLGQAQTVDWQDAMAMVEQANSHKIGGHSDWRMPMVPELASIVERQCFNPRMNTTVFPGASSEVFWSSMEKKGTKNYVYTLDFGGGQAVASDKQRLGAVRLVRGGPWWQPPKIMSQR